MKWFEHYNVWLSRNHLTKIVFYANYNPQVFYREDCLRLIIFNGLSVRRIYIVTEAYDACWAIEDCQKQV